jgi:hypothetical protein
MLGSLRKGKISVIYMTSRPVLGPTEPPIQWVPEALSPEVKRPEREADHSPPSSTEVKYIRIYSPLPCTFSWRNAQLFKHGHERQHRKNLRQYSKLTESLQLNPSSEAACCVATREFPKIYGTRMFITVFTRSLH